MIEDQWAQMPFDCRSWNSESGQSWLFDTYFFLRYCNYDYSIYWLFRFCSKTSSISIIHTQKKFPVQRRANPWSNTVFCVLSTYYFYRLTFHQTFECIESTFYALHKCQSLVELLIRPHIQRWFKKLREFQEKSLHSSET